MKAVSLCSGYGGLDLAVEHVYGAHAVYVADIDRDASTVLAHRFPDAPNLGDLTLIDWNDIEPVDIITAGYPCQPFSHAGRRQGEHDDRHIWPEVLRAIRALRPGLVVLENVRGHLSLGVRTSSRGPGRSGVRCGMVSATSVRCRCPTRTCQVVRCCQRPRRGTGRRGRTTGTAPRATTCTRRPPGLGAT